MERKRVKQEWVSEDFSAYLSEVQRHVRESTGQEISKSQITSILATIRPSINLPPQIMKKNKRSNNIFDF